MALFGGAGCRSIHPLRAAALFAGFFSQLGQPVTELDELLFLQLGHLGLCLQILGLSRGPNRDQFARCLGESLFSIAQRLLERSKGYLLLHKTMRAPSLDDQRIWSPSQ